MNRTEFLQNISKQLPKNPICIEIGVHGGFFSKYIFKILKPQKLYLVDPWEIGSDKNSNQKTYSGTLSHLNTAYSTNEDFIKVNQSFAQQIIEGSVVLKKGFSYDVVNDFPDAYFDFIYIDATHIYECVKADLTMYFPKLKHTGFLCGHDYCNHPSFSVIPAVDEFVAENNLDLFLLSNDSDFAIKRNNATTNS
jgi:hypothetical protein